MKPLLKLAMGAFLSLAAFSHAAAAEYTRGEITKIDPAQKKLTIRHEELKNLEMPAMTMVFVVADDAMLEGAAVGQTIEFVAERVNGRLTVTEIRK